MKSITGALNRWGIVPIFLAIVSFAVSIIFDKALLQPCPGVQPSSPASDIVRGVVVAVITYLVVANIEVLQKVKHSLESNDVEKIGRMREHIDGQFLEIFDRYFDSVIENINSAIEHKKITIHTVDQFRDFYVKVLGKFPNTTFLATSSFNRNYFWTEDGKKGTVEFATKEFIKEAGSDKFIRIFLVTESDKRDPAWIREVLEGQKSMGVTASCLELSHPKVERMKHERFILVAENKKFAWEVHVAGDYYISKVEITVNANEVERHLEFIKEIESMGPIAAEQYIQTLSPS